MNQSNATSDRASQLQSVDDRLNADDLNYSELTKLWRHSQTIKTLGILLWIVAVPSVLIIVTLGYGFLLHPEQMDLKIGIEFIFLIAYLILYVTTAYISFGRPTWGRVIGIILYLIFLIGFPIGTIWGAFGLNAFFGGKLLFGPDRYTHAELKTEYTFRNKNKVK